jgi:23S rRNA pseudouridine2604 synthase
MQLGQVCQCSNALLLNAYYSAGISTFTRMADEQISLNKYISSTGFCSRRAADELIEQARVTVNDELVLPGARILFTDKVAIDGEPLKRSKQQPIFIALNKPQGVTSTTDPTDRTNIIYFLQHPKRVFPIGRLDKDSDGLIFLTNDGDIVNKILRAGNLHEKEYVVVVNKAITLDFIRQMEEGVNIGEAVTRKCRVKQEGGKRFRIILTQGLNRQIRRMCKVLGYDVVKLTRVRIMNISLGHLAVGKWRYLSVPEVAELQQMVAHSSKTEEASLQVPTAPKAQPKQYIPKKKKPSPGLNKK